MKKNKRKAGFFGAAAVLIAIVAVGVYWGREISLAEENDAGKWNAEKWGQILAENAGKVQGISAYSTNSELYAVGKNGTILKQDIEQAKEFYLISGLNEEDAQKEAVKYAYEREALYQEAVKNGYQITNEEIWSYLGELKDLLKDSENGEDAQKVMDQFDSEEAYWEYEFTVYQKDLPIQKYVAGKRDVFMDTAERDNKSFNQAEEVWENYFETLKKELVEKENFKEL